MPPRRPGSFWPWHFKLSEYRDKVVVLIFCGHWCGPCRAMNPHKQALIRRYAGKPFALLEVNATKADDQAMFSGASIFMVAGCWARAAAAGTRAATQTAAAR
jgi:thiol-disulfide isomerase/thioredoxin